MRFDADRHGNLALGLEGGHSRRRVAHAAAAPPAGASCASSRAGRRRAPRSRCSRAAAPRALRIDDGRCAGVGSDDGRLAARAVVLATGGAAALWSRTTNPPGSFGAGLLLAARAGATLADLELIQFHPTAVAGIPGREGFLVTEAIRGEGATLHDAGGERFVDELAPRDEVARAIRRRHARPARRTSTSTCAASTPGASPTSSARCARPASTPTQRAGARLPRRPTT